MQVCIYVDLSKCTCATLSVLTGAPLLLHFTYCKSVRVHACLVPGAAVLHLEQNGQNYAVVLLVRLECRRIIKRNSCRVRVTSDALCTR